MVWRLLALPGLQLGSFVAEGWAAWRGESPYAEVPAVEPSFRVIAEAVLDRSFTLEASDSTKATRLPSGLQAARPFRTEPPALSVSAILRSPSRPTPR